MPVVRVDDIDLHYAEAGSDPPLLLIHGLGSSHLDWEAQLGVLRTAPPRHRVIAPDLRGFGDTPRGRRLLTIERFTRDLVELVDRFALKRLLLVGHSMGGAIAQQLMLELGARAEADGRQQHAAVQAADAAALRRVRISMAGDGSAWAGAALAHWCAAHVSGRQSG